MMYLSKFPCNQPKVTVESFPLLPWERSSVAPSQNQPPTTIHKGDYMRKGTRRVAAAVFALGLIAAACGDDDSSTSGDTTADTTATADTTHLQPNK